MNMVSETALVLLALSSLLLLGSSRLVRCIHIVAAQGMLLGALTLTLHGRDEMLRGLGLALAIVALKAALFPWLLSRVLREADVRREVEPFVSYNVSIVLGTGALATALWLSARLPLPTAPVSPLVVPVALFVTLAGLFLIVSRRKALSQVLGYLVLENGIYTFGVGVARGASVVVELGVLLDVFAAVFVMGIAIFHINREFDHIEADQLAALRDWDA